MTTPGWATLVRADNPGPMTLEGTNTWVLQDASGNTVIDPGPLDETHLQRVAGLGPVARILLTHRHPDHADGAQRFGEITGAPVLDRDEFAEDGCAVGSLRVLHTPGHSSDSVCFVFDGAEPGVLTGDTILGRGTAVIAYPDGNLASYLESLERLRGLGDIAALPGHGPALRSVAAAAAAYLQHRLRRLDQVRAALAFGDRTAEQVVARVYADVHPVLWPTAELSVRAQLAYLDQD